MGLEFLFTVLGAVGAAFLTLVYAVEGSVVRAVLFGLVFAVFVRFAVRDYRQRPG